jgi:TonB family protein
MTMKKIKLSKALVLIVFLFLGYQARTQEVQFVGDKYTYEAMDKRIEGNVYVSFLITPQGRILEDSVKAISQLYGLERIAEDVIKKAPPLTNWYKLKKSNEPTKNQRFVIPVKFSLDKLEEKDWSEYYRIKGNKSWEAKEADKAKEYLLESVRLNKHNRDAYHTLSLIFKFQGDEQESQRYEGLAKKYGFKE